MPPDGVAGLILAAALTIPSGASLAFAFHADPANKVFEPDPSCSSCDARHQNLGQLRDALSQEAPADE